MRRRRSTQRAGIAALTLLLWLIGVEVLPGLHLAGHEADHTHDAHGTIVRSTFELHDHGDGVAHAHAASHGKQRRDQLAYDVVLDGHAAAGIAHRMVALHAAPPPALAPVEVPRHAWWIERAPIARPAAAHGSRPSARGPPAA